MSSCRMTLLVNLETVGDNSSHFLAILFYTINPWMYSIYLIEETPNLCHEKQAQIFDQYIFSFAVEELRKKMHKKTVRPKRSLYSPKSMFLFEFVMIQFFFLSLKAEMIQGFDERS